MEKQIQDLTVQELKAAAYDVLSQLEFLKSQLQVINQELAKRHQEQNNGGSIQRV